MEEEAVVRLLLEEPPRALPPPCPFTFNEEELLLLSLLGDDGTEVEFSFDKGCLDPELGNKCSPCFSVYKDGDDFKINERPVPYTQPSPVKQLLANKGSAEFLAKCTRRMRSINSLSEATGGPEFATTVSLAEDAVGSARHAVPKDPPTSRHAFCTIVNAYPAVANSFEEASRAHLKWGNKCFDIGTVMTDPVTDVPWSAEGSIGKTCDMDFEVLPINNSQGVSGRKQIPNFEHIMLPASVSYITSTVCGVVSFPMADEVLKKLQSDEATDRLCKQYIYTVRRELLWTMKSKHGAMMHDSNMNDETKLFLRNEAKKELRGIVRDLLKDCFGGFQTGTMICSMGRLLGANETMLAANYSTLLGSSGGAVFSPHYPAGTFIGIHAGPALATLKDGNFVFPDHNLATSTDNPAFFVAYFMQVLPRLPSPSAFADQERAPAFRHYLLKHLKLIVRMALQVNTRQEEWLKWAVQGEPALPLARVLFEDPHPQPDPTRRLLQVSEQLLGLSLKARSKGNDHLPTTLQRDLLFAGIQEELKRDGVLLQPWGKVANADMLVHLASQLSGSE